MASEKLAVGLSSGRVYLGAMGHPDYARPDIMGEVVNLAFLILDWVESGAGSGIGAAASALAPVDGVDAGRPAEVNFKGIELPVTVYELGSGRC